MWFFATERFWLPKSIRITVQGSQHIFSSSYMLFIHVVHTCCSTKSKKGIIWRNKRRALQQGQVMSFHVAGQWRKHQLTGRIVRKRSHISKRFSILVKKKQKKRQGKCHHCCPGLENSHWWWWQSSIYWEGFIYNQNKLRIFSALCPKNLQKVMSLRIIQTKYSNIL